MGKRMPPGSRRERFVWVGSLLAWAAASFYLRRAPVFFFFIFLAAVDLRVRDDAAAVDLRVRDDAAAVDLRVRDDAAAVDL